MPRLPIAIAFAALWAATAAAKGAPPSEAAARCAPDGSGEACAARMIIGGEGLAEELRVGLHGEVALIGEATLRAALEAYLAERASWGEHQAWEELAFPILPDLDASGQAEIAPQDIEAALGELEERYSWVAHPVRVAGVVERPAATDTEAALKALLAERESWGTHPSQPARSDSASAPPAASSADTAAALKALLEERASWGTKPSQATAAPAAPAKPEPGKAAATSPDSNEAALKALLEERAAWGTKPSQATAAPAAPAKPEPGKAAPTPSSNEAALKALLKERASWGTKPSQTAALSAAPAVSAQDCEAKLRSIASEGGIHFESASATLDPQSHQTLDRLAAAAKECGRVRIRIEGHTDDYGTARSNQALSQQRAQAVAAYLSRAGVEPKRLQATGLGETKPLVANDSPENRAKNRRIEFSVR